MEENTKDKRRDRIKTILIIFLSVLLLLTFFSNTILNWSLPTVSAQYAGYGTITEKVRGTGYVTANHTYNVLAEGDRKVTKILVKSGDQIKAGDKLFELTAADNAEEIKTQENALKEAELSYQKALLTIAPDYAKENQAIANARNDLEIAIDRLNAARAQTPAPAGVSAAEYKQASNAAADAQEKITTLTSYLPLAESGELDTIPAQYTVSAASAQNAYTEASDRLTQAEADLTAKTAAVTVTSAEQAALVTKAERDAEAAVTAYERAKADSAADPSDQELVRKMEDAEASARYAQEDVTNARNLLAEIQEKEAAVNAAQEAVSIARQDVENAKAAKSSSADTIKAAIQADIDEAKAALDAANAIISGYSEESTGGEVTDITTLENAVTTAQRELQTQIITLAETKKTDDMTAKTKAIELQSQQLDIEQKKTELEKLKKDSGTLTVTSQNAGVIESIACAVGDEVTEGTSLASITLTDSGYTVEFSVTPEQARKVTIGAAAEITNSYYSDITAILVSSKADKNNPSSQNKLLTFEITGSDVTPGQMLALSIPCSSQNYDCVVPSSAIQSGNDGKFVLVLDCKSTPLGNRYYARKEAVTVLASDDLNSAVQGNVSSSDFVITTSEKPIKPGNQVRMEEK